MNYQLELDKKLAALEKSGERPKMLLHACCGPCSSYVLECLTRRFDVSVYYYNPNIWPPEEYEKRLGELQRLVREAPFAGGVESVNAAYEPERFDEAALGLENEPEGGKRCAECFKLRLRATARAAREGGFDCFTTTLSVSPHKDAKLLNELGALIGADEGVEYIFADFKKRGGYKRSIELSREYSLYRQVYCGCRYSLPR